jgi:formylglycine-generating enzyme required for sulfatase activity
MQRGSHANLVKQLKCDDVWQTWTDDAGRYENMPVDCVNWYTAFAFCVWDGGRLPTEAEWEYAAAGGAENRLYPWGNVSPVPLGNYAWANALHLVGTAGVGVGKWGNYDFAGNAAEWTFDGYDATWYSGGGKVCIDCANGADLPSRSVRGFLWLTSIDPAYFRAALRELALSPASALGPVGFRCARSAP